MQNNFGDLCSAIISEVIKFFSFSFYGLNKIKINIFRKLNLGSLTFVLQIYKNFASLSLVSWVLSFEMSHASLMNKCQLYCLLYRQEAWSVAWYVMLHCKRCYFSSGDQPFIFDNHLWKKSSLETVSKSVCQMNPNDNIFICLTSWWKGSKRAERQVFFSLSFFSPLPFWCYCHLSSEIDPEKQKHVQNIIHFLNLEGNGLTLYIYLFCTDKNLNLPAPFKSKMKRGEL